MNTKGKEFVVSVADFAFYINGVLACTGVTNLSSSISVSMQEQAVNAGKGNKKVFSYKYGRELTAELEAADWKLEYIALQAGSQISKGLKDSYSLNECVTLVGNAFKTISMRIRGATTELEEAGLETDGMAESTAKLQAEIKALSGVDIMLDKDTFKSTYQIMDELSEKWQDLTDIQQASITELLAGKHQGNVMSSLMNNFDIARQALEVSMNSEGSAMEEHEKWMESIEAKVNQLKAAWEGLSNSFLDSGFVKGAVSGLTGLVQIIDALINKIGVVPTLLTGVGIAAFVKNLS